MCHFHLLREHSESSTVLADVLAGRPAGAWTAWRAAQQPLNRGRLPQRLIRRDDFLDEVTACYDEHCRKEAA